MSLQDLLDGRARRLRRGRARFASIDFGRLPRHVAVIMDGNGRWAQLRHKRRVEGHRAGIHAVRDTVETSARLGLEVLTLYAFSIENWKRPQSEVATLMGLLKRYLRQRARHPAREQHPLPGDRPRRSELARGRPERAASGRRSAPRGNTGLQFNIALNYGGRAEITDAVRGCFAELLQDGRDPDAIDERALAAPPLHRRASPTPTCSSAPAASCGSPTSCSGRSPTRRSGSPTCSGPTSGAGTCSRPSWTTRSVSDATAGSPRLTASRRAACAPRASGPTSPAGWRPRSWRCPRSSPRCFLGPPWLAVAIVAAALAVGLFEFFAPAARAGHPAHAAGRLRPGGGALPRGGLARAGCRCPSLPLGGAAAAGLHPLRAGPTSSRCSAAAATLLGAVYLGALGGTMAALRLLPPVEEGAWRVVLLLVHPGLLRQLRLLRGPRRRPAPPRARASRPASRSRARSGGSSGGVLGALAVRAARPARTCPVLHAAALGARGGGDGHRGRPRREPAQALGGGEGLGHALPRPRRACSTGSTACCSARRFCTIISCTCAERLPQREGRRRARRDARASPPMKGLAILGSTGSIGTNVLRVVDAFPGPLRGRGPRRRPQRRACWPSRWPATARRSSRSADAGRARAARPASSTSRGVRAVVGARGHGRGGDPTPRRGWWWRPRWARSASCPPTARSRRARTWRSPTRRRW